MQPVIITIHLIAAFSIIALVLIQKSEGGGLGMGGGGGMGNLMSPRGAANFLTRLTAIMAVIFMTTSMTLGILASRGSKTEKSILDIPVPAAVTKSATEKPAEKATPQDSVPKPPVSK